MEHQPAGRLGDEREEHDNEGRADELQRHGNLPTLVCGHMLRAKGHQGRYELPQHDHELQSRGHHASEDAGRRLACVDGDHHDGHAGHSKADEASNRKLGRSGSCRLEQYAAMWTLSKLHFHDDNKKIDDRNQAVLTHKTG